MISRMKASFLSNACAISLGGFHEEIERKGARPKQTRDAQVAVHWSGVGVQNHQEVDIAIRRGVP